MFTRSKKLISMLIVFVMVFTYMGQTLEAIAASDGLSAITNGFFGSGEMNFKGYFDESGAKNNKKISNVNEKAVLTLELAPNDIGKGFLKEGIIQASSLDESDINFKFSKIKNIIIDEPKEEIIQEEAEEVNNEIPTENADIQQEDENLDDDNSQQEENNLVDDNEVSVNTNIETDIDTELNENVSVNEVTSRSSESREEEKEEGENEDKLINEEEIIQEVTDQVVEETYEELTAKDFEIEIINYNQIKVQNVIYNTIIEVEIEYNKQDKLTISDLYKDILLQLRGTFINIDLDRIEIQTSQEIKVGWTYNKEFDISSEYTQFSPFKLGDHTGIIVENKINVKREITDENYLPIRQTTIEVDVPKYNGILPETVVVKATKLMATKGEDLGEISFNQDNWNYNEFSKKINITVTNEDDGTAVNGAGEDEYIVVYRYNTYTEDEKVTMDSNFKVTVEEYSSNENIITTKQWNNTEEILTKVNDLITYNVGTTEGSLNKSKINANYNSEDEKYETQYTTLVNVNILTSDLLEELKIDSSKEVYLDNKNTEFDASEDVYYNKVKFNYNEIKDMLQNGATIELQSVSGDLLYTLNNDLVQTEENCEVKLKSKEKGIYVVFKNISVNGNIGIEFTKAIGKSKYDKSTFYNFKKIKSYVSSELKYKSYDEKYGISEIATVKELSDSKTVAEISLSNNNLSTIAKNDSVEMRIALNNDKQDSDLYINPNFELTFPKYVKDVTVKNINLMYKCGLSIGNYEVYKEDDLTKIRIELNGIQTEFSESVITNGTNILLNLNIELDEYTPRKQDQIKMYYYNEGVTNYKSQTKWNISKQIPNGILKDTNGFDIAIINYQSPSGLVTANGIINYDGQGSKIKSIAQGEAIAEIDVNQSEQKATMELVAMNNTENTCTDTIFIGRIPFKENKSVTTNKDLGTTVNATMLSGLEENIENINMATIYYSSNENATKDLNNKENGWSKNVINFQNIKSYMIVIKGEMLAGTVLKYTYDFEIPSNLNYDQAIYGSFGGFYNNNSKVAVYYESTEADRVGVVTKKSLPIKLKLDVDVGDGEEVKTGQYLNYILKVVNEGTESYSDIKINTIIPENLLLYEKSDKINDGNNGYEKSYEKSISWDIDEIKPGESKEFLYMAEVASRVYGEEFIENSASMIMGNLNNEIVTSNTVKNKIKPAKFKMQVVSKFGNRFELGSEIVYEVKITNITDEDSGQFDIVLNLPEGIEYKDIQGIGDKVKFDEKTRNLIITVNNLENGYIRNCLLKLKVNKVNKRYITLKPFIDVGDGEVIYSTGTMLQSVDNAIKVNSAMNFNENQIVENQEIEVVYNIKNVGDSDIKDLNFMIEPTDILEDCKVYFASIINDKIKDDYTLKLTNHNFEQNYDLLRHDNQIEMRLFGKVKNIEGDKSDITLSKLTITGKNIEEQTQEIKVAKVKDIGDNEKIKQSEADGIYEISGNVWVDENGDGIKAEELENVSAMQVQLLKDGKMLKATTTDNEGNYKFTGLANGSYGVIYNYDKDTYMVGEYVEDEGTSKGYELTEGTAVSDEIIIDNSNVENIDLGIQEKEKFDLNISEAITKAIINIDGEETEYEYADLDLAKIEIEPSKIDKATIKFKYKINIENTGNVEGKVTSIVDYLPAGMTFKESENEGWSNGMNGNIYNDSLRDINILPGEVKELTLILSKKFNEDNTGVLSNKVKIAYTENSLRLTEAKEGNFATQETIVMVTQGGHIGLQLVITTISLTGMIAMFAYMIKTGKIDTKFNGKSLIKKVYK